MVGLPPGKATHHGRIWHSPRLSKTSPIPCSTAAGQHGARWGSDGPITCLWLMMSLHHLVAPALGYCTATRSEPRVAHPLLRPDAKGSNLMVGRTVFCRQCLPVPGAQGFLPATILCVVVTLSQSTCLSFLITALLL